MSQINVYSRQQALVWTLMDNAVNSLCQTNSGFTAHLRWVIFHGSNTRRGLALSANTPASHASRRILDIVLSGALCAANRPKKYEPDCNRRTWLQAGRRKYWLICTPTYTSTILDSSSNWSSWLTHHPLFICQKVRRIWLLLNCAVIHNAVFFIRRNPNGAHSTPEMVHWPTYDADKQQYLRIGKQLIMKSDW